MPKLKVKGLPSRDWGGLLIRLNYKHRNNNIKRNTIAKIKNNDNNKITYAVIQGCKNDNNIYMDYESRIDLGVHKNEILNFKISKAGIFGIYKWYSNPHDPRIRIPAKLVLLSIWIGVASLILGMCSLALYFW